MKYLLTVALCALPTHTGERIFVPVMKYEFHAVADHLPRDWKNGTMFEEKTKYPSIM
jgi:hypothetical protein